MRKAEPSSSTLHAWMHCTAHIQSAHNRSCIPPHWPPSPYPCRHTYILSGCAYLGNSKYTCVLAIADALITYPSMYAINLKTKQALTTHYPLHSEYMNCAACIKRSGEHAARNAWMVEYTALENVNTCANNLGVGRGERTSNEPKQRSDARTFPSIH